MTLAPELDKIRDEIALIDQHAVTLCDGLSEEQLAWRPQPQRWSIAENLIHLKIATEQCIPGVDLAISNARAHNICGGGPFKLGLMGKLFVWWVEPPPAIRLPAPKTLVPRLEGRAIDALPSFLESQKEMIRRLEQASGLDLNRARFNSPFASFVSMDLLAFFSVFAGHGRRHLWQAENVRRQLPTIC